MLAQWNHASTLDHVLDDVMGSLVGATTQTRAFSPSVDVRANENEVALFCDVPGVSKGDLEITLENHVLTIAGERKFDSEPGERAVLSRQFGSFQRSFTLADDLDEEKLTAHLADGVLTIRIPKHPKAKPRKIEIGEGGSTGSGTLAG